MPNTLTQKNQNSPQEANQKKSSAHSRAPHHFIHLRLLLRDGRPGGTLRLLLLRHLCSDGLKQVEEEGDERAHAAFLEKDLEAVGGALAPVGSFREHLKRLRNCLKSVMSGRCSGLEVAKEEDGDAYTAVITEGFDALRPSQWGHNLQSGA
jgi:hypothetical protein